MNDLEKKIYENAIKKGEVEEGYVINYEPQKHISFKFRKLDNHTIIEQNGKTIGVEDSLNDEKIKKSAMIKCLNI